jgi:hypothetical protein
MEGEKFLRVLRKDIVVFGCDEAALIALVADFEARNRKCWVSRKYLGRKLGMSEATAQRKITKLVELGALTKTTIFGRRFLETVPDRWKNHEFSDNGDIVESEVDDLEQDYHAFLEDANCHSD